MRIFNIFKTHIFNKGIKQLSTSGCIIMTMMLIGTTQASLSTNKSNSYRSSSDIAMVNSDNLSVNVPCVQVNQEYYQVTLEHNQNDSFFIAQTELLSSCGNPTAMYDHNTAILNIPRLEYRGQLYMASLHLESGLFSLVNFEEIAKTDTTTIQPTSKLRVPAEWEPHAATWMQWPNKYDAAMRQAFADIIRVIQKYEPVHLLTSTEKEKTEARQFLIQQGVSENNITWHIIPINNAWMRDNGPIYVNNSGKIEIQNWKFDAWGGNFGAEVDYQNDNQVPYKVASYLGLKNKDYLDYVLEKGNLEFNGAGILVLNWDCQDDRNPGLSQAQHEEILKQAFGVTKIIWAYGHIPGEGTIGHIDGTARFINEKTLAIAEYAGDTEKNLAIAAKQAGLNVIWYPGDVNWLVGNGFVVASGDQDKQWNKQLKSYLQEMFPNRNIHLIDAVSIGEAGGGIHCVTNDQPAIVN